MDSAMESIDSKYFKEYRLQLGFTSQSSAKQFFAAKDITPTVDYAYMDLLNKRLFDIVQKINDLVMDDLKLEDIDPFCNEYIYQVFEKLKEHKIISRLNNQGRRPEQVYFSWMRGYIISNYFLKALSLVFSVDIEDIDLIGDDDLIRIETFKRTPRADLEISLQNGAKLRLEIQSGFQGINDVKQHKVLEAKKIFREEGILSLAIHFDLFNGQVAFVQLDSIKDDSVNWITRQQMEGQTVLNINQNYFIWKLTELPPRFSNLSLE